EGLLPELQLDRHVQLLEPRLQMALEGVRVAQVDGVHLGRVLGGRLDMVAEKLAEAAELGLAGMLLAEVEGLHRSALVEKLEAGIVAEDVQNGPVRLPQELEPGRDDGAVGAVL